MIEDANILKKFLELLFEAFNNADIEYCVIGNYEKLPEFTSNDVDIWIGNYEKSEAAMLMASEKANLNLYMQNKTSNGSNNYFYYSTSMGLSIIKIDLITETAFKSIFPIVKGDLIRSNREKYKGFYVANEFIEGIMHLFYPLIAFGIVKDKYKEKILRLVKMSSFRDQLVTMVDENCANQLINNIEAGRWEKVEKQAVSVRKKIIQKTFVDLDKKRLMIFLCFIKSVVSRIVKKNGLVVSFTGIDGAGKTTIKEHLLRNGDRYFAKGRTKEFYWRPFLVPRLAKLVGSKGQEEILDNSGKRVVKTNLTLSIKSTLKYSYYVFDFLIGQIKYFKEAHTGGLVIFDRYHFDNIIYPERFGFRVNKGLMRFFDRWIIPQPDILFYFTADTDVLYERKHEIDIGEINQQKAFYEDEIKIRKNVVVIYTDGSIDNSIREVLLKCFELMNRRYSKGG